MRPEISLLIDGDQVTPADVGRTLAMLESDYRVTSRVCIRNWRSSKDVAAWKQAASDYALQCLQRDPVATGKNASDIELAIMAMDQFHGLGYRHFCLISADTDFTPLVDRLRRAACTVEWVRDTQAMQKATDTRTRAAAREGRQGGRPKRTGAAASAKAAPKPVAKAPTKPSPRASARGRTPSKASDAGAKAVRRAITEIRKTGKHDKGSVAVQRVGQWLADEDLDRSELGGSKSAPLWKALAGLPGIQVEQREDGRYWVDMD